MKQAMITLYFNVGDVTDSEASEIANNLNTIMRRHAYDLPCDINGYPVQFSGGDFETNDIDD